MGAPRPANAARTGTASSAARPSTFGWRTPIRRHCGICAPPSAPWATRRVGPLVFKNLLNSLRLEPLGEAFPEAIFLVVQRDLADNVASILAARRSVIGDVAAWWSAEPPGVDELRRQPPEAQAAGQVTGIHELIDGARQRLGPERFLDIAYEQLCADTHAVLAEISGFASSHGLELALRRSVPPHFEAGHGSRLLEA